MNDLEFQTWNLGEAKKKVEEKKISGEREMCPWFLRAFSDFASLPLRCDPISDTTSWGMLQNREKQSPMKPD